MMLVDSSIWTERYIRVFRVIYNESVDPVAIVTAYFDDEFKDR
jgi:hypothetical protein